MLGLQECNLFSVVIVFFLYTGLYVALAGFKLKRSPAYASLSNGTKGECHHTHQSFLDSVQPVVITKVLQPTNPLLHPSSHLEGGSAPTVCPSAHLVNRPLSTHNLIPASIPGATLPCLLASKSMLTYLRVSIAVLKQNTMIKSNLRKWFTSCYISR